jgi:small GTP-binding protein
MSIKRAKKLIAEAKAKMLTSLYLGRCGLTDLEKEVPELFELEHLEELSLYDNKIADISALANLQNLQVLYLHDTNITDISALANLQNLCILNLSFTKLIDKQSIFNLFKQKSVIAALANLQNLQELNLNNTKITDISALANLKNLRLLQLFSTQITNISVLSNLQNLHTLNLCSTQITDINALANLQNLQALYLNGTQITDISALENLQNLQQLRLNETKITSIRPLLHLLKRKEKPLQCVTNKESYQMKDSEINLKDCPLTHPPMEIVVQGNEAIINYFESLAQADKEEYLYEAKLVLVGRGATGKTTLAKKLTDSNFHLNPTEVSTNGIAILGEPWAFPTAGLQGKEAFTLNVWDFGGQEKYDATHQFFITERTVYLFLTEARKESNYLDYDYWLRTIELLSKNSPVIVVQNKTDERDKAMPEDIYKNQFKNIEAFVKISCVDGWEHSLDNLKGYLRIAVSKLRQNREKLSNRWVEVREHLQTLSKEKDYISYQTYIDICTKHKIPSKQADFLSGFLHDLGIIIHHQKDMLLKQTVIINPEWGVDGVYKVIDDKATIDNNGYFSEEDLQRIWSEPKYQQKQPELLGLMKKFELCFEVKPQNYLSPELLSLNPPKDLGKEWETKPVLPYRYTYSFMPAGIMGRLIVKGNANLYQNHYWKTGAVFQHQNAKAKVEEFYFDKKLHISLQGEEEDCKALLAILRNHIDAIHKSFENLPVQELLPCCCAACKGNLEPYFHLLEVVRNAERNPQAQGKLQCQKSFAPVFIQNIKNAVYNQIGIKKAEESISKLVAKDQLREALDAFEEETDDITLLKRELHQYEADHTRGILQQEAYNRKRTDIGNRILQLARELERNKEVFDMPMPPPPPTKPEKEEKKEEKIPFYKKLWGKLAIFMGALTIFFAFTSTFFGSLNDGFSVWDRFFPEKSKVEKKKTPSPIIKDSTKNSLKLNKPK